MVRVTLSPFFVVLLFLLCGMRSFSMELPRPSSEPLLGDVEMGSAGQRRVMQCDRPAVRRPAPADQEYQSHLCDEQSRIECWIAGGLCVVVVVLMVWQLVQRFSGDDDDSNVSPVPMISRS